MIRIAIGYREDVDKIDIVIQNRYHNYSKFSQDFHGLQCLTVGYWIDCVIDNSDLTC